MTLNRPTLLAWAWAGATCLVLSAGPAHARPADQLDDDGGFATVTPDPEALARYHAAAAYSDRMAGRALLVIEGDAVVFEALQHGYDGKRGHAIWSGTKSFACALALAAEAKGLLRFDERVADTLPEVQAHAVARTMTVRDLLAFTSGLDDNGKILAMDWGSKHQTVPDKPAWTLAHLGQLQLNPPGRRFTYVSAHHAVFAALMRKKLDEDPVAWLRREVLDPIGFEYTAWLHDLAGNPAFAFGVYTTPRSWARFGVLARDDGMFRGKRILPAGAFAKCFVGSEAMPNYGLNWWLNEPVPTDKWRLLPFALRGYAKKGRALLPDGPPDIVTAAGYKDNRLYVIPSRDLVIVRFGTGHPDFSDPKLLGLLLGPTPAP